MAPSGPLDGNPPRKKAGAVYERPSLTWVDVGDPFVSLARIGRVVEKSGPSECGHDKFAGR